MTSILLVAQLAPPSPLVAARRAAGLTKHLARLGYRVTVLTSVISGDGPVEGAERVVRTPDLMASPLNWRRRHFAALIGREAAGYRPPSRLQDVIVPDLAAATWLPLALPRAFRLGRFDTVITTSPPSSAHLVGRGLQRRGARWIAELRDGWTFEPPHRPWPLAAQRRVDHALEARLLRQADAVVGVTDPIVANLRERLGVDAELITNGFDLEEHAVNPGLLEPSKHSFVHTGRLALAGVSSRPLLEAVRLAGDEDIELLFAGPLSAEEQELLAAPDLAGLVRATGSLDHAEALGLQRAADTLLVVTGGAERRSVATGKLFEYLFAGRPILVLGEETEAARVVAETRTGMATSATDPHAIANALRIAKTAPAPEPDPAALEHYTWPALAARYAELIERS